MEPVNHLISWLQEEKSAGAPNPQQAVLSTAAADAIPHGRVVAIREINEHGLLFFTQRGTRKVMELTQNPQAALTFWLELSQREVMIEGHVQALALEENEYYWQSYPREAQIRFHSYAPTSFQVIQSKHFLEKKRKQLEQQFKNRQLPMSEFYCGYRLKPERFVFYSYRLDTLSDVIQYEITQDGWLEQRLSP